MLTAPRTATYLISPHNGRLLVPHAPHLLSDGELLWPMIDDIAYLRLRHELREPVVALLQREETTKALVLLLQDQDPFAPIPPPDQATLHQLIGDDTLSLRAALRMLNYGPVADYFAYRSATPTFLSGLALLQRIVRPERPTVEIACGMGHFLSTLEANGLATVGVDLVFSKLWLARRYLNIQGTLVCGDIEQAPPLATEQVTSVFCHDAFYFFEPKVKILNTLRTLASGGPVAVGHVHTNAVDHNVAGHPLSSEDYQQMAADNARFFDDAYLANAWLHQDSAPQPTATELSTSEAVAWIEGKTNRKLYSLDQPATALSPNPLLDISASKATINWPTERFRQEYEADAGYLQVLPEEIERLSDPDQLGTTEQADFFRRRILLDLPTQW